MCLCLCALMSLFCLDAIPLYLYCFSSWNPFVWGLVVSLDLTTSFQDHEQKPAQTSKTLQHIPMGTSVWGFQPVLRGLASFWLCQGCRVRMRYCPSWAHIGPWWSFSGRRLKGWRLKHLKAVSYESLKDQREPSRTILKHVGTFCGGL